MTPTRIVFMPAQQDDWTWLLKIPVKAGEPVPMEFYWLWTANTLMPLQRKLREQEQQQAEAVTV